MEPRHTFVHHVAQKLKLQPDALHLVDHAQETERRARLFPSYIDLLP